MRWRVVVTGRAEKQLGRLPAQDEERLRSAITAMTDDPFLGDVTKLGGEYNAWRRRIGAYRIMYKLLFVERSVFIYDIRRRTSTTY